MNHVRVVDEMVENKEVHDITIIGGGPAGLFTAFYAGMRKSSVKIIESLPHLGGQLSALYPEKYIYDVPGFPKIKAQELVDHLLSQLKSFEDNTTICLGQTVLEVEKEDDVFIIRTEKEIHYSKTIIITAGNGSFKPRKLQIDGAEKFEDTNLNHYITDLKQFTGKRVAVLGGGDSAVDWSLMLEPIAKEVSIIHRRDKFRAHEHSVHLLEQSNVRIVTPHVPVELIGDDRIEKIVLQKSKSDETETIEIDELLVNYGFISSLGPIKDWELELEKNSIVVNSKMETNIPGIYAVGDINTYDGKVKLIVTGFGEAATAVSNAKVYIDPTAKVQTMHSTSLMEKLEKEKEKVNSI